jgi:uncharacterized protein (DUF2336 family)
MFISLFTLVKLPVNPIFTDAAVFENMDFRHPLLELASDKSREAREALVSATAEQFLDDERAATLLERTLFSDILVKLYSFARQEIRQKLSSALAMADWAPVELARELALDTIDIAQPVLSFCPVINEDILVEVVNKCDFEHRMCVADRPLIGETVTQKLINTGNTKVVATLARNVTARIKTADFKQAIEILRDHQDDIDALVSRHDLPASLIAVAYGLAGAQTRIAISMRLPTKLEQRLTRLTEFVAADSADGRSTDVLDETKSNQVRRTVRQSVSTATPGILLAALMRGERGAFYMGLAALLDLPSQGVARKLTKPTCETVALAARAANFDASIVRTIYETLDRDGAFWSSSDDHTAAMVWMRYAPAAARAQFGASLKN